jgi:hypothetical protein
MKIIYSRIIGLPLMPLTIMVLLTSKIGFAAADSVTGLKLVEQGVPKEKLAMLAIPMIPLQIILPWIISKYTAGPKPMDIFLKAMPPRLLVLHNSPSELHFNIKYDIKLFFNISDGPDFLRDCILHTPFQRRGWPISFRLLCNNFIDLCSSSGIQPYFIHCWNQKFELMVCLRFSQIACLWQLWHFLQKYLTRQLVVLT